MTTIEQILLCLTWQQILSEPAWRFCIVATIVLFLRVCFFGVILIWREERRYRDFRRASKAIRNGRKP